MTPLNRTISTAFRRSSGFPLTRGDQITFNLWIADEAHALGLGIGIKNVPDLLPELAASFDFALLGGLLRPRLVRRLRAVPRLGQGGVCR